MDWERSDFVVAGLLIGLLVLGLALVASRVRDSRWRNALRAGVVLVFVLTWAELAVGIFG